MCGIEKLGTPTLTLATTQFVELARATARAKGVPDVAIAVLPHPVGGIVEAEIRGKARAAIEQIVVKCTARSRSDGAVADRAEADLLSVSGSANAASLAFYRNGWTDGLPIVPPTREAVREMLRGTDLPAEHVLGAMPPAGSPVTLEKIAINAVMAGCRPTYLPALIAALEGMLEEGFDLAGVQTSTGAHSPLLIVNGPTRHELRINCSSGALGPGWQANATIGRAVRLVQNNVGGARIGLTDMTTLGAAENYTYCLGENEEANPWTPFHVDQGFQAHESTVSVIGAFTPEQVSDHVGIRPEEILAVAASVVSTLTRFHLLDMDHIIARESVLLLSPEHAASISNAGWSKADAQRYLYENCRLPYERLRQLGRHAASSSLIRTDEGLAVPMFSRPDALKLVVAGGPGKHSAYVNTGHSKRIFTKKIVLPKSWAKLLEEYGE